MTTEDNTQFSVNLMFPARGSLQECTRVFITNDDRVEDILEQFRVQFLIPSSNPFASSIQTLSGQATIDIRDDDREFL